MKGLIKRKRSPPSISELKGQINQIKFEIKYLKERVNTLSIKNTYWEEDSTSSEEDKEEEIFPLKDEEIPIKVNQIAFKDFIWVNNIDQIISQKWFPKVPLIVNKKFTIEVEVLLDSGADVNCIGEGIIPSKYYSKTTQFVSTANQQPLIINYKLCNVAICNSGVCLNTSFIFVKNISSPFILGTPFFHMLFPIKRINEKGILTKIKGRDLFFPFTTVPTVKSICVLQKIVNNKENFVNSLKEEIKFKTIKEKKNDKIQEKIKEILQKINNEICAEIPNAFWNRK